MNHNHFKVTYTIVCQTTGCSFKETTTRLDQIDHIAKEHFDRNREVAHIYIERNSNA